MRQGVCMKNIAMLCALAFVAAVGASASAAEKKETLRVVSWNVQTFFDGQTDGGEYAQFKGAHSFWSEKKYMERLSRLASALRIFDADVIVLEELEKREQLYDIFNQLSGTFHFSKLYRYGCFARERGGSIGCGVLSRYTLSGAKTHSLDIGTERGVQPSLRPLLEVQVEKNGRALTLFVCHWKSKLGADSAVWRTWQERTLALRAGNAAKSGSAVLVCGDFNQRLDEFALLPNGLLVSACTDLPEPSAVAEQGTYWYKGAWECIDHFFVGGGTEAESFCIEHSGDWADELGRPFRYDLKTGEGWSDHFPISCTVRF